MALDLIKNKEFIEKVVNLPISSYEVSEGCKEGDNVAGALKSIRITPEDSSTDIHVVLKFIPPKGPEWITMFQVFRVEHAMYRTIAPTLREFAEATGLIYDPPIPYYYSGFNDDKGDYICMEDVRPSGFIMPDKWIGRTQAEVGLVLRELAKFHAVSYAYLQSVEDRDGLFSKEDWKFVRKWKREDFGQFDIQMLDCFEEVLTILRELGHPDYAERMSKLATESTNIRWSVQSNDKYFETLTHSDLWTNNLLIKYNGDGQPEEVKFIDFQGIRRGNIFLELQYFFFTSTTPEYRRKYLEQDLAQYFDIFEETLEALGCPCPGGFTKAFLLEEFRSKCYLAGFIHMTFAIPFQLGGSVSFSHDFDDGSSTPKIQQNGTSEHVLEESEVVDAKLEGGLSGNFFMEIMRQGYRKGPLAVERLLLIMDEMIGLGLL